MNNPISPEFLAKLRAAEGEGLSRDPKNNRHKSAILLQDKDLKWCRAGARAGQYLIGDKLFDEFVWMPILFVDSFIEWGCDGGRPVERYFLPNDARWDPKARCYFLANGNSLEEAAQIVGLINGEPYWQSFSKGALTVARYLNSAAGHLVVEAVEGPLQLPFFGANWRMGSIEKPSSNGNTHWLPTYELVATVGQPGGPGWDDFDRGHTLHQRLSHWVALAQSKTTATNDNNTGEPPESDAPPPTGADTSRSLADLEDIPF
jgi:hypothetical protein